MIGRVLDADWDYSSPYITSGYTSGDLRSYVLTWDGSDYRIYRLSGLRTTSVAETLQATFSTSNNAGFGQIRSSKTTANFAICALIETVSTQPKVRFTRTTDGSTWSSLSTLGDADAEDSRFGISLEGSNQLIPAGSGVPGEYGLFRATSTGGAFSALSANITSAVLPPLVANNGSGTAYATQIGGGQSSYEIDFDSVNDLSYVLSTLIAGGTATVAGGGNPGNCAFYSFPAHGFTNSFNRCSIDVTGLTIAAVDFDAYTSLATSRYGRASYGASFNLTSLVQNTWVTCSWTPGSPLSGQTTLLLQTTYNAIAAQAAGNERIDNILITTTALAEGVYKFTTYATSPARTNVTPSGGFIPRTPYALAADGSNVSMIAEDDDGYIALYESANDGGTWTDRGSTVYSGIKRAGDLRLAFGDNRIALSENGVDWFSKYGEYGAQVATGEVQGILVLL